ncbi:hypothetical protein E2C01_070592 [Portunus trituberculatus]|uniref:Uncharacterized protein n=1 Tax=Portunus trituberculatus TaxID=210409 RepID=A0A5B7I3W6_PORTR|nr:hypothetical protein [Portunus trituberculatus]
MLRARSSRRVSSVGVWSAKRKSSMSPRVAGPLLRSSVRRQFSLMGRAAVAEVGVMMAGVAGTRVMGAPHRQSSDTPSPPGDRAMGEVEAGWLYKHGALEQRSTVLALRWSRLSASENKFVSSESFKIFSGVASSRAAFSCPAKSASRSASGARCGCLRGMGERGRMRRGRLLSSSSSTPTNLTGRACGFPPARGPIPLSVGRPCLSWSWEGGGGDGS